MASKKRPFQETLSLSESDDEDDENPTKSSSSDSDGATRPQFSRQFYSPNNANKSPAKKLKTEHEGAESNEKSGIQGIYSDKAKNMMANMGFKLGMGLGKHNQGRTEIVESSKQRGRKGLGTKVEPGLERSDVQWNYELDEAPAEETIDWMPKCSHHIPTMEVLLSWAEEGKRKKAIDDEVEFCDPEILEQVLQNKNVFDKMEGEELRKARTRSNPYETIRGAFFLNRAAMKMANMDAICDFMFTNPQTENGEAVVGPDKLLYFADVCAGPGGFSEYVLWRKKWKAKGFGFTLKGANDFKLEDFFAGPCETFETHYGVNGSDGDGDVFRADNQLEFRRFVLKSTNHVGVDFMMADGGFSVEGEENIQEILSKQLYLCQCLVALSIVRPGGHFVCKLFDLFTPFSVGLVYLMYLCFKRVSICKPVTSRPANSERYIVCKWLRDNSDSVREYLHRINQRFTTLWAKNMDVIHLVPLEKLKNDEGFYEYIRKSNNDLGQIQIRNLEKIQAFYKNPALYEPRQSELRKQCLDLWKIPDHARSTTKRPDPATLFKQITNNELPDYMSSTAALLCPKVLDSMSSVHEYRCVVTGGRMSSKEDYLFVLSLGRTHVYHWDGCGKMEWKKLNMNLELPKGSLFYAEVVNELQGEGRGQKKVRALHILDVAVLGEENVSQLSFSERMRRAEMFVHAVSKPSKPDYISVRVKKIYKFTEIERIFDEFESHVVKGKGGCEQLCYPCDDLRFYVPLGVMIFKVIKEPWMLAFSKSRNQLYYFNSKNKESTFEAPEGAFANFKSSFQSRLVWNWEEGVETCIGLINSNKTFSKENVVKFIHHKTK